MEAAEYVKTQTQGKAMEKKAGCRRSKDITKYFSASHQPVSMKSVLSEPLAEMEKPEMSPCHFKACTEVSWSDPRSATRQHRLKRNKHTKASTGIKVSSNEVIVVSEFSGSSAETKLALSAVLDSSKLTPVGGQCHEAEVGLESCRNEIPRNLTIQPEVQSAVSRWTKSGMLIDKCDASIFTKKQDTDEASGSPKSQIVYPERAYELVLNESSSTHKCRPTESQESIAFRWRNELSFPEQRSLVEDIKRSNPLFPVRRVFAMLLKKYKESLQVSKTPDISATSPLSPVREKRKHPNERDDPATECKRQRSNLGSEGTRSSLYSPSLDQRVWECQGSGVQARSKLSRTHRLAQRKGPDECLRMNPELTRKASNRTESPQIFPFQPNVCLKRGHYVEDMLWTEKYQPRHSSEVIDNSASVKKLHSWLKKWKLWADSEERRKEQERKLAENPNSNDTWDCGDFQGETGEAREAELCNTMLITGPPGVGKTAAVYACSLELGFQVFEVNASSQRCGRHVLTHLREATQSHQVEAEESSTLRPSYLRSCNNNNSTAKCHIGTGKVLSSKKVVWSSAKGPPPSRSSRLRRGGGGGSKAGVNLTDFFQMKSKPEIRNSDAPSLSTKHDQLQTNSCIASTKAGNTNKVQFSELSPGDTVPPAGKPTRKTTTSLILFEEVDVIFDDDTGFLTAIQTLMRTSKRPVILTTCDPYFSTKFDGDFEKLLFKTPSVRNVCSYLQLLCLAENVQPSPGDVASLVSRNRADVRRSMLQLQLWVCSGEGPASHRAQSVLGLYHGTMRDPLTIPCLPWAESDIIDLMETLTESWRTGVALLYSNLEILLPLPASTKAGPVHGPQEVPHPSPQDEGTTPDMHSPTPLIQNQISSVKMTSGSRLRRRNRVQTSDSRSDHQSPVTPHTASLRTLNVDKTFDDRLPTKKVEGELGSRCLEAIADFMDLMSYIDASLSPRKADPCGPEELALTGAEVRDGLLDEMREEDVSLWGWERTVEIQAAVEVLGFQRCLVRVSDGWTRTQGLKGEKVRVEKPTILFASDRQGFSVSQKTPCETSVVQKRRDITRTILSSNTLCTLGNKQAVVVDYLPVLRAICQLESAREERGGDRRFLHYLRSIHFSLPKASLRLLAEDFP
ncbi:hypothetical protein DPEC_G00174480 [Dallia pectoralis]|uniref:Uncharacterized protein n=1 Tax=Dallia pectoralis TaxID=75939 RepID=A0ACC2GEI1_DALPE|nr:hypothetical protein DPEC_G00174480 [Dallia pectoralis]